MTMVRPCTMHCRTGILPNARIIVESFQPFRIVYVFPCHCNVVGSTDRSELQSCIYPESRTRISDCSWPTQRQLRLQQPLNCPWSKNSPSNLRVDFQDCADAIMWSNVNPFTFDHHKNKILFALFAQRSSLGLLFESFVSPQISLVRSG